MGLSALLEYTFLEGRDNRIHLCVPFTVANTGTAQQVPDRYLMGIYLYLLYIITLLKFKIHEL